MRRGIAAGIGGKSIVMGTGYRVLALWVRARKRFWCKGAVCTRQCKDATAGPGARHAFVGVGVGTSYVREAGGILDAVHMARPRLLGTLLICLATKTVWQMTTVLYQFLLGTSSRGFI